MWKDSSHTVSPIQPASAKWQSLKSCSLTPHVINTATCASAGLNAVLLKAKNFPKLEFSLNSFTYNIEIDTHLKQNVCSMVNRIIIHDATKSENTY